MPATIKTSHVITIIPRARKTEHVTLTKKLMLAAAKALNNSDTINAEHYLTAAVRALKAANK